MQKELLSDVAFACADTGLVGTQHSSFPPHRVAFEERALTLEFRNLALSPCSVLHAL